MKKATEAAPKTAANLQKSSKFVSIRVEKTLRPVIVMVMTNGGTRNNKPRYQKPQAVKELEKMADADNAAKHPNTPVKYLAKSKYRDDSANGLTKCIIDYIRFQGGQAERINTTGIPKDNRRQVIDVLGRTQTIGGIEWRPSGSTVGSADISATIKGRSVKIEVKIGRDRQSEAQRQYQVAVEKAGGFYYIARDFTTFLVWYRKTF